MDNDIIPYLAGIVDGEGSIGNFSNGKGKKVFTIEVKMTYKPIIDLLHTSFGGCLVFLKSKNIRHKDLWKWRVKSKQAEVAYSILSPFLLLKNRG